MKEVNVLIVDDDKHILDLLKKTFQKEEMSNILLASNGVEALTICKSMEPNIIILDVMLPDIDGFELCKSIREEIDVPILFLTAKGTDLDKLAGFSHGGDDYITKPFNPLEIVARVKVHMKRQYGNVDSHGGKKTVLDYGRFRVNEQTGQLFVDNRETICPAKEFQLLVHLCKHPNQIFTKNQLYERIWGAESFGDTHTVMVHIRRLREKIEENPSHPDYILTVRGLGYKIIKMESKR